MTQNDKNINKMIGNNLRLIRKIRNISLHELGAKVGVTGQQIQKYEAGKNRIPIDKLIFISQIFNVKPEFFLKPINLENLIKNQS